MQATNNGHRNRASEYFDRQPPCDIKAEIGVIGSIVLHEPSLGEVAGMLRADDFYDDANGVIYKHILSIRDSGKKFDPIVLIDSLTSAGQFAAVGGSAYVSKVINAVPNAAHAIYYAEIVAHHAARRRMIVECTTLLRDAYDGAEPDALIADAHAAIGRVAAGMPSVAKLVHLAEAADEVVIALERPEEVSRVNRAMFGVPSVDEFVGPMMGGEITILAARPKVGKTFFGQQVLRHAATQNRPGLLVNLEMDSVGLGTREVCRLTDVDSRNLRRGNLTPEQVSLLRTAQKSLKDLPFYLWTPAKATMPQIRNAVMQAMAKHGVRLVVIDYLTLIDGTNPRLDRREQLVEISRHMKQLARESQIPFLVLAQLNRSADGQAGKAAEPRIGNLAECGAFERDADTILFLHQEGNDATQRKFIGAALRNAPPGSLTLRWNQGRTEFTDSTVRDRPNHEPDFDAWNNK
jgi:replicative DNA helicase